MIYKGGGEGRRYSEEDGRYVIYKEEEGKERESERYDIKRREDKMG